MDLTDLTPPEAVFPAVKASSKKHLLQDLSHRIGDVIGVDGRELFAALLERERLGSTGMGRGVAIPHCRLGSIDRIWGAFARLETPVEFEAVDGEPVDLLFVLVAPDCAGSDHLKALARVSRVMRDPAICAKLRGANDAAAIHALLAARESVEAA